MVCPVCGTHSAAATRFCSHCGSKLSGHPAARPPRLRAETSDQPTVEHPADAENPPWLTRTRLPILVALVAVLVLALALGGAYAYTEVDRRDQAIAEYTRAVSELTAANQTFQRQVQELGSLRDELTAERDALARERDALATERDQLNAQLAVLQKQVTDLGRSVEEKDRQLTQAWEEGSRQQSRAESAEALSFVLGQVIEIDNQIHDEIWVFLDHIADINHAYNRGNPYAFAAAYGRAEESAKRLDALFAQRQQILAQLS